MGEEVDLWETLESLLPDDWEMEGSDPYDFFLICPHGERIEMDGFCPVGCKSPFRAMGMI